jgi:glycosyltransferase involved in cell wall biosynthesis
MGAAPSSSRRIGRRRLALHRGSLVVRVSVDVRPLGLPGIGRFATELAAALLRRAGDPEVVTLGQAGRSSRRSPARRGAGLGPAAPDPPPGSVAVRSGPFGVGEQLELPRLLRRLGVDVHHVTHLSVPRRSPVPVVLTVHDLFPLSHPGHARSAAARTYYRAALPSAVRSAAAVVAVSELTAAELDRLFGVRAAAVIGHGVDHAAWSTDRDGSGCPAGYPALPRPYVLYVGTAKPHKNLLTLLAAHRALPSSAAPPLVLAGPTAREVARAVPRAVPSDRLVVLGRVPDAWLPPLYRGAAALAVPSLYEGVGLAALEAMSFGIPVVAADSPGLRDTVGDAAALVPPTHVEAWADALVRMSGSSALRDLVVTRGLERAAAHRWDDAAAGYAAVYGAVAGGLP